MLKNRHLLPPLDYFVAFESAGSAESFSEAARDLNLSETAVSRKIKLLEQHYDQPLFVRGRRSVTLTLQGQQLLEQVRPLLIQLVEISRDQLGPEARQAISLAATNSVSSLWLMPRLRQFKRLNHNIKIELFSSDDDKDCMAETNDLVILRGEGEWPGFRSKKLFGETVFPVCAPDYLQTDQTPMRPEKLTAYSLIDVASSHTEWMTWREWLRASGNVRVEPRRSASFNTYPLAIQAAVDGVGIALGWGHLVDPLLKSGQLIRPLGDLQVRTKSGYYLLVPRRQKSTPERRVVEKWLLEASATRLRYG